MRRKELPPLGGEQIERICARELGTNADGSEIICGSEPVAHVFWDEERLDNAFACEEHWREIQDVFSCWRAHGIGADCGMPGALFFPDENVCRYDEAGLPVAEVARKELAL